MENSNSEKQQGINELKQERESFRSRMFLMMIEIAFVFLIPALIAVFISTRFDFEGTGLALALVTSFVVSWVIVVVRYRQATRTLKDLSNKIDAAQ